MIRNTSPEVAQKLYEALSHLVDDAYHHQDGDDRSMTLDVTIERARAALRMAEEPPP